MERIGLLDVDMSPIKENLRELSEGCERLIEIRKKGSKLPNGRYKK